MGWNQIDSCDLEALEKIGLAVAEQVQISNEPLKDKQGFPVKTANGNDAIADISVQYTQQPQTISSDQGIVIIHNPVTYGTVYTPDVFAFKKYFGDKDRGQTFDDYMELKGITTNGRLNIEFVIETVNKKFDNLGATDQILVNGNLSPHTRDICRAIAGQDKRLAAFQEALRKRFEDGSIQAELAGMPSSAKNDAANFLNAKNDNLSALPILPASSTER